MWPKCHVLKKKPNGQHYEEVAYEWDAAGLQAMHQRAKKATLDGHVPVPGEKYASRSYYPKDRPVVLVKLTYRKPRCMRV
jgi:hypothetical protein